MVRYENSINFIPTPYTYYSQEGQDRILEQNIFKGFKNGVFVDVGAHDGVDLNNTLFFEATHNWRGINIEPITSVYNRLITNRPYSINLNLAVNDTDGDVTFRENVGYSEMLSGIESHYNSEHIERINGEINRGVTSSSILKIIEGKRLDTIFNQHDIKHINYLSVDVEGGEYNVIQSINFDCVFIDVIGFEDNYGVTHPKTKSVIDHLLTKNFNMLNLPMKPDIFMINKNSKFIKH